MSGPSRASRLVFGAAEGIAGTVYGTILAMAALTAGAATEHGAGRLAVLVASSVLVIWLAHVYAHALSESIQLDRRLDRAEVAGIARREVPIALAGVGPTSALVLGAVGVLQQGTAVWLALGIGLVTLAVEGVRYARIEQLSRGGELLIVLLNLALGLLVVALKVLIAH